MLNISEIISKVAPEIPFKIFTLLSFSGQMSLFISYHPYGMELNLPLLVLYYAASAFIIVFVIYCEIKLKNKLPDTRKIPKAKNTKRVILLLVGLWLLAQSGSLTLHLIDDLSHKLGTTTYIETYKMIALFVYEGALLLSFFYLHKIIGFIVFNNKNGIPIMKNLSWYRKEK